MAAKRTRRYVKSARAESEQETRDRIVRAVIALHTEIGPARTTVKGIAGRAGVQRLTVYRHFPDDRALLAACSSRWIEDNPLPALSAPGMASPERRARQLLLSLFRYYRRHQSLLTNIFTDAAHLPLVEESLATLRHYLRSFADGVDSSWPRRSARRLKTIHHAVQFETWRSLSRLTDDDAEAVALVMRWCEAV